MPPAGARMRVIERSAAEGRSCLALYREDLSDVYPGLLRYSVVLESGGRESVVFRTNTYEYAPGVPLEAEEVANLEMERWESILSSGGELPGALQGTKGRRRATETADVLVIQGSPRPSGNCSILARYVKEISEALGKSVKVLFPADMDIKPCIGCYRCYNYGECTFDDDMEEVIQCLHRALLVVVCSPVYTNTVPGPLKNLLDRCQEYHARRTLGTKSERKRGIIIGVAGRTGEEPFDCVVRVVNAFMRNLDIEPSSTLLFGGMDMLRDVEKAPDARSRVEEVVKMALLKRADI